MVRMAMGQVLRKEHAWSCNDSNRCRLTGKRAKLKRDRALPGSPCSRFVKRDHRITHRDVNEEHRGGRGFADSSSAPTLEVEIAKRDRWRLSPAEKEVALLLLKGLSHKEIAKVRSVTETTARQQARAVYRKAGLSGRHDLAAFFLEDLMLPTATGDPAQSN
ncbi:MAG: helix-turn-helix transcriptional regulator [Myxococcales bacterium]|nr:helix-turn-helix transcriptional regulator [Deltaproteobacteria bacterium]NNE19282.1 helix-turn-helix transcriptional regulator [Myxococcales bacterium]